MNNSGCGVKIGDLAESRAAGIPNVGYHHPRTQHGDDLGGLPGDWRVQPRIFCVVQAAMTAGKTAEQALPT